MADKVYCEDCRSILKPYINVEVYECKHKNNTRRSFSWLRPKVEPFDYMVNILCPSDKNVNNDCEDFEPK